MAFRYLEEIAVADVAFQATGATLEEMFTSAAEALLGVMLEESAPLGRVAGVEIELENAELDLLLFSFLAELVFYKDARRLLLRVDAIKVESGEEGFRLHAVARGETIDPARHPLLVDVKAVTMHRLQVLKQDGEWEATVVLDV